LKEIKNKFIKQNVIINHNTKRITLPNIFFEFKKDFKMKDHSVEDSIKLYLGDVFNLKFDEYLLKETEVNNELNFFAYFQNKELAEKLSKEYITKQMNNQQSKKQITLKQKVDEKLEIIKFGLVPLDNVEKLTSTQIHGISIVDLIFKAWVLKFLSTQCGIETTTKKTFFKTFQNACTTESLISWFEVQRICNRENSLKFIQKLHDLSIVHIISGGKKISDSPKQSLQIQVCLII
jgi:hypothetical protein